MKARSKLSNQSLQFILNQDYGICTLTRNSSLVDIRARSKLLAINLYKSLLIQDYGISTLTRNSSPVNMKGVVSKQSLQFPLISRIIELVP
jgi:hypothetical protein